MAAPATQVQIHCRLYRGSGHRGSRLSQSGKALAQQASVRKGDSWSELRKGNPFQRTKKDPAAVKSFKEQSKYLVNILLGEELDDDEPTGFRSLGDRTESEEPKVLSEKNAIKSIVQILQQTGDLIDKECLNSFTAEFQTLAARHTMEQACELFSNTVNIICQKRSNEKEFESEKNLLKISASLGIQTLKQAPNLIEEIKTAMTNFIASSLETWVNTSNGWENIDIK
ncbi:bcl-2-like protein 15 [Narcine bancroftii]|uniref:bcl-2-like protein 15 n=1 Tax=Narcine bancroftii TaxID=1343680 RepID=UPI0038313FBE